LDPLFAWAIGQRQAESAIDSAFGLSFLYPARGEYRVCARFEGGAVLPYLGVAVGDFLLRALVNRLLSRPGGSVVAHG
jgi:hypothetical protein